MFYWTSQNHISTDAYSKQPFTFVSSEVHNDLASVFEIGIVENGDQNAREVWQQAQLQNLLHYAYSNSAFWRNRIPQTLSKANSLRNLPVLTRNDLMSQVNAEGSLFKSTDASEVQSYSSSGSTGTPVKVHSCPQNARYNGLRSVAQYLIEGRQLNHNRTFIKPADGNLACSNDQKLKVEYFDGWLGSLSKFYVSGKYKVIHYNGNENALIEEIKQDDIGYLACLSSHMDILLKHIDPSALKNLGMYMWLHHSDNIDNYQRDILSNVDIPTRSGYSCSEVGPIAVECVNNPGFYHVAHSNVIVEVDYEASSTVGNEKLGRLLVTHLHSYATPLIRYEVGDFAKLHSSCPCGHDGITLSHIYGRKKYFLKTSDGELISFPIFSKPFLDVTSFTEFFVYQPDVSTIAVELGGRDFIADNELIRIKNFIGNLSQHRFNILVSPKPFIDWTKNPKRLPFISYVT